MVNDKYQVIVAQLGRREHYAIPIALNRARMLGHFFTDAYAGKGSWLYLIARISPFIGKNAKIARFLARTAILPSEKVTAFNWLGIQYNYKRGKATSDEVKRKADLWAAIKFTRKILKHKKELAQAQVIYSFNGAALELFSYGASRGKKLILNQVDPSLFEDELMAEESSLWPEWEIKPAIVFKDELFTREKEEWELADLVIVNSEFSKNALISLGVKGEKIRVVPLAVEVTRFYPLKKAWGNRRVNFLFLGTVGLRKGIQYALEAFNQLSSQNIKFTIAGFLDVKLRIDVFQKYLNNANYLGPMPGSDVASIYQSADVFVFPTISDGFGITQIEAMACGLPVITTPNAGSVVRDGVDGFIIPIRDAEALAEKMELLARNPDLLAWMSQNARERAQDFSWEKYGKNLVETIRGVL